MTPTRDTLGPITRTVRDTAIVLDVIAGYEREGSNYCLELWADAHDVHELPGSEMGSRGCASVSSACRRIAAPIPANLTSKETQAAITKAAADMAARGAQIIDPATIDPTSRRWVTKAGGGEVYEPETAINEFLAQHPNSPVHTFRELAEIDGGRSRGGARAWKKGLGHTIREIGYLDKSLCA